MQKITKNLFFWAKLFRISNQFEHPKVKLLKTACNLIMRTNTKHAFIFNIPAQNSSPKIVLEKKTCKILRNFPSYK